MEPDGGVGFSLRSRYAGGVDVGKLATTWGGGGHPGAAGFTLHGNQAKAFLVHNAVVDESKLLSV